MRALVLRRLWALVPVWVGISVLAFALGRLAPGDPAVLLLQAAGEEPTPRTVRAMRRELGLDQPAPVQYVLWLGRVVQGNLGVSYRSRRPVLQELLDRFPATLALALPAFLTSAALAVPLGVLSAVSSRTWVDHATRVLALVGITLPSFLLAYLLVLVFGVQLGLLPVAGREGFQSMVLPAVTLALPSLASLTRLVRAGVLEVLGEDYVRVARAKGVPERRVLYRHALPNALIPALTAAGIRFGHLVTGAVIVETVFSWPGLGRLVVEAIQGRDYPVIQGFVLFSGTLFVFTNLLVDVTYRILDPRVRVEERNLGTL